MKRGASCQGRVLIVAGSDSGGGAGVQADIKTVTALGGFAMTAVTALTAQDTTGVHAVMPVPADFVAAQMRCVLADLGAEVVKTGMLASEAVIDAVCEVLEREPSRPFVVADPVMVAKGGHELMTAAAVALFKRRLLPLTGLLTPNVPEAEALCGLAIADEAAMWDAAEALLTLGVPAVLLKGGHLPGKGEEVIDLLATETGTTLFRSPRVNTRHTHGTGCTLASAVATGLAQGLALAEAVVRARAYVQAAIRAAPGFGAGHGPLGHGVTVDPERLGQLAARERWRDADRPLRASGMPG